MKYSAMTERKSKAYIECDQCNQLCDSDQCNQLCDSDQCNQLCV